eukprot:TRINITY_DN6132_c0_g1_i1.p3 TRINITY_DN6132_c0_g1~~TRINITY_DN6132_c0_g1_i1.p3  ORF type:complete len:100 (+),score=2.38 TRINITY_DN6132_c0_g1_i1:46-300(+)
MAETMQQRKPMPDLSRFVSHRVKVSITATHFITGILAGYDPYMNLIMDHARAFYITDGQVPAGEGERLGRVLLRGMTVNSVVRI